jgi:hypothetical protein
MALSVVGGGSRWRCAGHPRATSAGKAADKKFFSNFLNDLDYVPRVLITNKLASYRAAKQAVLPGVEHRLHCYVPTHQRERRMG